MIISFKQVKKAEEITQKILTTRRKNESPPYRIKRIQYISGRESPNYCKYVLVGVKDSKTPSVSLHAINVYE